MPMKNVETTKVAVIIDFGNLSGKHQQINYLSPRHTPLKKQENEHPWVQSVQTRSW